MLDFGVQSMEIKALTFIVLLTVFTRSYATKQCNLINFATNGSLPCFMEFWPEHKIRKDVTFEPNATQIVNTVLKTFDINLSEINIILNRIEILGHSDSTYDTLSKIIETGATEEPYIMYSFADLMLGFNVTPNEIARLGLPGSLTQKSILKTMYTNYLSLQCERKSLNTLANCLNTWLMENCDTSDDDLEFVTNLMMTIVDYYCLDSSVFRRDRIKSAWDSNLGAVWVDLMKEMGIYKDNSESWRYLFNIDLNQTSLFRNFSKIFVDECGYVLGFQIQEFSTIFLNNSTVGTGTAVKQFHEFAKKGLRCVLRTYSLIRPRFWEEHSMMVDHIYYLVSRFGFQRKDINWNKVELGSVRVSVTCYGDPHLLVYKRSGTVTCPAHGQKIYLANEYFQLRAYAKPVSPGSDATYATSVSLAFKMVNSTVSYVTSSTGLSQSLVKPGLHSDEDMIKIDYVAERGVRITDLRSGAVFVINKLFDTYYFTARMGSDLMDNSFGLLISGCSDQVDISPSSSIRRKRATNVECVSACLGSPEVYRDSCVYDCTNLDNLQAVKIITSVVEQQEVVADQDEKIMEMFPTQPPTVGDGTTTSATMNLQAKALLGLTIIALFL